MRRQKILLISLAVVFCLFIVGYIFVVRPMIKEPAPEAETETPETEAGEVLLSDRFFMFQTMSTDDISEISVSNEHGGFSFVRNKGGQFIIEGYERVPYDANRFATLTSLATYTLAKTKVISNASDEKLDEYGLLDPQASWTVTAKDGKEHKVYVGDRLITGGGYYCMYDGRRSVYVLDTDVETAVLCPVEDYVSPVICNIIEQEDFYMVEDFTVYKGKDPLFSLRLVDEDEKINKDALAEVIMDYPTAYYPNSSYYYEVLYQYMNLSGDSCYKLGVTDEDLKAVGLDAPAHTVMFEYHDEKYVMYFSELQEDGTYYAATNMYPEFIVKVPAESVEYLEFELIDWIEDGMFRQYITNLSEIKVESGDTKATFELYHSLSADGTREILDVVANGNRLSEDGVANFRQYYKSFLAIMMEDYILNDEYCKMTKEELEAYCEDEDNVYLTFSFKTLEGKETVMKFYRYSTRHSAATINGVGEFYVVTDLITKIANDTGKVLRGETVTAFDKY